jgi:integration host factor subunit beta
MDRDGVRTITKKELAERVADATGEKRTSVKKVVQSLLEEIVLELSRGNRIEFREFGGSRRCSTGARLSASDACFNPPERSGARC